LALCEEASSVGFPKNNAVVANYLDWRAQNTSFEDIGAYTFSDFNLTGSGDPINLQAARVTASVFPLLRVTPLLGRSITGEDDHPDAERIVLLSHGIWQSVFGGDPGVVGRTILLSGNKYNVIGVMRRGFAFPIPEVDLWMPARFNAQQQQSRGSHYLTVIGRLKPGVSIETARADIAAITQRLQEQYPRTNKHVGSVVLSLRDEYTGEAAPSLLALAAAVGCLLLITCANVANLLLIRATGRRREIAVRAALGAGRWQLARQMLVESLLLAGCGGVAGVLFGWWTFEFLSNLVPRAMSGWVEMALDWRVLGFAALISLAAGLLFGLIPVRGAMRFDLTRVLQQGGGRSGVDSGDGRVRNALVVGEVALSIVLLICAGLLIRSFAKLRAVDLGFRPQGVLTVSTDLPDSKYEAYAARMHFYGTVLEKTRALPGVRGAGYITAVPLEWKGGTNSFTVEGRPALAEGMFNDANSRIASDGYFEAMGIPLLRGRLFGDADVPDAPPVAVINEAMAGQFWPGEDVIGKRFKLGEHDDDNPWFTIVGVVGNVRQMGVELSGRAEFYRANQQVRELMWNRPRQLVVRTDGDPLALAGAVRQAVWSVDPEQPVSSIQTMESIVGREIYHRRMQMILLGTFAALALGLASLGIYGVLSFAVSQRTREIGLRMALGARREQVLGLVMGRASRLLLAGVCGGLAGAWGVSRWMGSLLFEVSSFDVATFVSAPLALCVVALLAAFLPARRAARVDPMEALRYE
jgi:predicted permease